MFWQSGYYQALQHAITYNEPFLMHRVNGRREELGEIHAHELLQSITQGHGKICEGRTAGRLRRVRGTEDQRMYKTSERREDSPLIRGSMCLCNYLWSQRICCPSRPAPGSCHRRPPSGGCAGQRRGSDQCLTSGSAMRGGGQE